MTIDIDNGRFYIINIIAYLKYWSIKIKRQSYDDKLLKRNSPFRNCHNPYF